MQKYGFVPVFSTSDWSDWKFDTIKSSAWLGGTVSGVATLLPGRSRNFEVEEPADAY